MSGIGWNIGLRPGLDDERARTELHRAVWDIVSARIDELTGPPARRVFNEYLSMAVDGFEDGTFRTTPDCLSYTFTDSAGLCDWEMEASYHWSSLAVLDRWEDVLSLAARRGVALDPPAVSMTARTLACGETGTVSFDGRAAPLLGGLLTGRSRVVMFVIDNDMWFTRPTDEPGDGHHLWLSHEVTSTLGGQTDEDRACVAQLVRSGTCACEPCQRLRAEYGLPLAAQPA